MKVKNCKMFFLSAVFMCSFLLSAGFVKAEDSAKMQISETEASSEYEVVWIEKESESLYKLYYSKYTDGTWQEKQLIVESDYRMVTPCVGGSGDQGNILIWAGKSEQSTDLYYSFYQNDTWSSVQKFETGFSSNLSPMILVDTNSQIWLVWTGVDGSDNDIYFSRWNEESWDAPEQVNDDNDTPDLFPVLGLNANGYPWIQWNGFEDGGYAQFRKDWDGTSWAERQDMEGRAVVLAGLSLALEDKTASDESPAAGDAAENSGSSQVAVELPSFIEKPEWATLHILKSVSGIQTVPLRDLYTD